jgi:hypothetical protein
MLVSTNRLVAMAEKQYSIQLDGLAELAKVIAGLHPTGVVKISVEGTTPPAAGATDRHMSGWGIASLILRGLAGLAAILVSFSAAVSSKKSPDPALQWTVLLLGIFIFLHILLELIVFALPARTGDEEAVPNPFNAVATVLVTTPGVVLALLAAFGTTGTLTTVVKVASFALATALLLAIILNGLVSMQDISNPPRSTFIRLVFNLTLWALALGIIGIAMGIIYRT